MKRILIISMLLFVAQFATAEKLSIQERLTKLEQQSGGQSKVADLVIQIQQLQQQIAQLQGTIEEQNFQISELKERQKVLYVDMDSRLAELEKDKLASSGNDNNELVVDSAIDDRNTRSQPVTIAEPVVRESVNAELLTNTMNQGNINATSTESNPEIEQQYQAAFSELKAGRFNESARLFEDFIQQHPSHELTDNSYYWLGESYYVTRNYPLALAASM